MMSVLLVLSGEILAIIVSEVLLHLSAPATGHSQAKGIYSPPNTGAFLPEASPETACATEAAAGKSLEQGQAHLRFLMVKSLTA